MNVSCTECGSVFRVDPVKVPSGGIRARCSVCGAVLSVADDRSTPPRPQPIVAEPARAPALPVEPGFTAERSNAAEPDDAAGVTVATEEAATGLQPASAATASADDPQNADPHQHPDRPELIWSSPRDVPSTHFAALGVTERPVGAPAGDQAPTAAKVATSDSGAAATRPVNPYLVNDPGQKARRLARALVSDLVAYHPQRREEGLRTGELKSLFREEIKKSYEEYVEQVGAAMAEGTPYFRDALNDVLAGGRRVF